MRTNIQHVLNLVLSAQLFLVVGCTFEATMTKLQVSNPSTDVVNSISQVNQSNYNLTGSCPAESTSVSVLYSGATLASGLCENGVYSLTIDFSSFSDGTLNLDIKTNQGGSSSLALVKDTQLPSAAYGLTDSTYFLSTTSSPILSWSDCVDQGQSVSSANYQVQVFNSQDDSVVKSWTQTNAGDSLQGLSLTVGSSYYFKVRCSDLAGNISISSRSDGWTVPSAVSLNPSTLISILAGETFTFLGVNGAPSYSFSDEGSGFINVLSGAYTVPLQTTPTIDVAHITDSVGQTAQTNINIQSFESIKQLTSSNTSSQYQSIHSLHEFDGALYGLASLGTMHDLSTTNVSY
ncbi:MAG TPA: hypothetical protein PLJ21_11245, partial [Pseudobdellovibrionaceae bacterium]|nr:hypothetical protein [Pseudobdellovibrionaceae bacterium]